PTRQATAAEAVVSPPDDGEQLNAYIRRTLFPQLPADRCVTGHVLLPGKPGWKVPFPCDAGIKAWPAPQISDAKVVELATGKGTAFAEALVAEAGVTLDLAKAVLAKSAGVTVSQLGAKTGGALMDQVLAKQLPELGGVQVADVSGGQVCAQTPSGLDCPVAVTAGKKGKLIGALAGAILGGYLASKENGGSKATLTGAVLGGIVGIKIGGSF
ncbi:MAG TPA: glycine zipper 2TM domain-containing protein, partial [Actinomycetes bacterium]